MQQQGSLACVGLGMMLGAHLSPCARSRIERADVVSALVSDLLVELLGGRSRMICMINAPQGDEEPETDPDDRDGDGVPDENQPPRKN